jgi:hypothetical protein
VGCAEVTLLLDVANPFSKKLSVTFGGGPGFRPIGCDLQLTNDAYCSTNLWICLVQDRYGTLPCLSRSLSADRAERSAAIEKLTACYLPIDHPHRRIHSHQRFRRINLFMKQPSLFLQRNVSTTTRRRLMEDSVCTGTARCYDGPQQAVRSVRFKHILDLDSTVSHDLHLYSTSMGTLAKP